MTVSESMRRHGAGQCSGFCVSLSLSTKAGYVMMQSNQPPPPSPPNIEMWLPCPSRYHPHIRDLPLYISWRQSKRVKPQHTGGKFCQGGRSPTRAFAVVLILGDDVSRLPVLLSFLRLPHQWSHGQFEACHEALRGEACSLLLRGCRQYESVTLVHRQHLWVGCVRTDLKEHPSD